MDKLKYEDGTLPKHVETFVRQKLTPREVRRILEEENIEEISGEWYLWARPFTTSSDQ